MRIEVNKDDRGELFETFHFPNDGQVFCVKMSPNATRGNHYHNYKTERFCVVEGNAIITLRNIDGKTKVPHAVSGEAPEIVTIKPKKVHNITTDENGCILLVWVDRLFDEENPDTYKEVV